MVNLVCEDSIEHGILHLLGQKQALADGVLDGAGDLAALKMPSGRAAMIERMQAMMQAARRASRRASSSPDEAFAEELRRRHGERALLIEARTRRRRSRSACWPSSTSTGGARGRGETRTSAP